MKIKLSELNSLITEVAQNNNISKEIAFIIDKQGVDTDEAITIYLKDNPSSNENSITQALTDFPISNGMDMAFIREEVDATISDILAEIIGEVEEEDELVSAVTASEEEPVEAPVEEPMGEPEEEDSLAPDRQQFSTTVQRLLSAVHEAVNEPKEYFALLSGQDTPEGTINYPGIIHMVVGNPREKRRGMRVMFGKHIGDLLMDYLESGREEVSESLREKPILNEMEGEQSEYLRQRYHELVMEIKAIIEDQVTAGGRPDEALSMIQDAIKDESISRRIPFAQDDDGPDVYGPFGPVEEEIKEGSAFYGSDFDNDVAGAGDSKLGNRSIGIEDDEELKGDVVKVLDKMSAVDTKIEYAQLIDAVLSHDFGRDDDKEAAIRGILGVTVGNTVIGQLEKEKGGIS